MSTRRRDVIDADDEPLDAYLTQIVEATIDHRVEVHPSMNRIVHYLDPGDERQVRMCRLALGRFGQPDSPIDELGSLRCKNAWCPWCSVTDHFVLANYVSRKIASVNPLDDKPAIMNLVFEPPAFLHPYIRKDPRFYNAIFLAARWTIAEAWGYEGKHGSNAMRECWREMGAIANFHAIGDRGRPWPKWFPHIDMLIPASLRKEHRVESIERTTWPEPYWRTRQRWEDQLRRFCMPFAERPQRDEQLIDQLETHYRAIFHCAENESNIIHTTDAFRRILYSCRPLVQLHRARIEQEDGRDVLVYEPPPHHGKPIVHRVPPGPAIAAAKSMREFLFGAQRRRNYGYFHKEHYETTAALAGKDPVRERVKKGRKMKAAYIPTGSGAYDRIDPRDIRWHLGGDHENDAT